MTGIGWAVRPCKVRSRTWVRVDRGNGASGLRRRGGGRAATGRGHQGPARLRGRCYLGLPGGGAFVGPGTRSAPSTSAVGYRSDPPDTCPARVRPGVCRASPYRPRRVCGGVRVDALHRDPAASVISWQCAGTAHVDDRWPRALACAVPRSLPRAHARARRHDRRPRCEVVGAVVSGSWLVAPPDPGQRHGRHSDALVTAVDTKIRVRHTAASRRAETTGSADVAKPPGVRRASKRWLLVD